MGIQLVSGRSNLSDSYDRLFNIVTWISIVVLLFVSVLMARFVLKYREEVEGARSPIGHTMAKKLEAGWTALAIFIILVLMAVSYPTLSDLDDTVAAGTGEKLIIEGTANWEWVFHVQNSTGGVDVIRPVVDSNNVKTTTMTLEVNKEYNFIFWASGSWIHSFFVPDLNIKMDVNPGTNNSISLTILEPGNYVVLCAEFCGAGHSQMRGVIIVE